MNTEYQIPFYSWLIISQIWFAAGHPLAGIVSLIMAATIAVVVVFLRYRAQPPKKEDQ